MLEFMSGKLAYFLTSMPGGLVLVSLFRTV